MQLPMRVTRSISQRAKRKTMCSIVLLNFLIDRSQFSCEDKLEYATKVRLAYPEVWPQADGRVS